jgi:hypothetical protein
MKTNHRRNFKARQEHKKGYYGRTFHEEYLRRERRANSIILHKVVRGLESDSDIIGKIVCPVLD